MVDPLRNNSSPAPFAAPTYLHHAFKSNSFRLDEGYSEETRSQAGSEMRSESRVGDLMEHESVPSSVLLPDWVGGLNESERSELAYALLRSLRTSSIAAIVERLTPLLHIDPIQYLPPEITAEILSYLDPATLLLTSTLSKSWRGRALDSRLWRKQFGQEGWVADTRAVREFEDDQQTKGRRRATGKARARNADAVSDSETKSPKKRAKERALFGGDEEDHHMSPRLGSGAYSPLQWAAQHDSDAADVAMEGGLSFRSEDTEMNDATPSLPPTTPLEASLGRDGLGPPLQPSLVLNGKFDPVVNWQYLYKQKRRLEANWQSGKYRNFQLPHPNHPDEAHAECVYTIQYSTKHLVSGSRDKTLRIWNLATQRLLHPPLKGHNASVLCLQFDDRPEEDIVVSGGSDCHVILWRFSTGKMITKLERAHSESVLNLRFDHRYLITCSKDKTIKIWNRKQLRPTDDNYPSRHTSQYAKFPQYIVDVNNMLETDLANMKPLKEYSLLATLEGHNAAVNAIQVLGSQIVSASGDRQVKIWNVKTGQCLKTITGHQKGIACVQFDGRRIVSGSSDETVRIFDRVSGAEVACLKGHKNLVRTVQARFGDIPGNEVEEEAEARNVDRKFYKAQIQGTLRREPLTREQRRARNAGGKDPNELFALGAMLPPGGGGSKWARIVSGSYDESVIIWRRDADGKWIPAHQLLQSDAVLGAGGQPRATGHGHGHGHAPGHHHAGPALNALHPNHTHQQLQNMNTAITQLNFQQWLGHYGHLLSPAQVAQMQAQMAHNIQLLNQNPATATVAALGPATAIAGPSSSSSITAQQGTATTSTTTITSTPDSSSSSSTATSQPALGTQTQSTAQQAMIGAIPQQWLNNLPHHPTQTPTQAGPSTAAGQVAPPPAPAHHHHHHHHHGHGLPAQHALNNHLAAINPNLPGSNSRVFKLQFDSRRIICCSQDPTIVGWDFANGDKDIEEASAFFGEDY